MAEPPIAVQMVWWDMGNVLFNFSRDQQSRALAGLPGCQRKLRDIAQFVDGGSRAHLAYEAGELVQEAFLGCLSEFLRTSATLAAVEESYSDLFTPNAPVCAIVTQVAKAVPCGLATNTDPSHLARVHRDHPDVLSLFRGRIAASCQLGVRKPTPAFYEHLVDLSGFPAGSLLFVDDLLVNVEAARTAGLQAVVFDGNVVRLIQELQSRRIHGRL
jgi:FMN phosphatase YigB (HAD superfamily)